MVGETWAADRSLPRYLPLLMQSIKKHLCVEPETELVTAVAVTGANADDGLTALEMLEQQSKVGLAPAEVVGDMAYEGGELRARAKALGEGTILVTKAQARPANGIFNKAEFSIDLKNGSVTCPAGQIARFRQYQPGHETEVRFPTRVCAVCQLAKQCMTKPEHGRKIRIHAFEHERQEAKLRREEADFAVMITKRAVVERKQAHWNRKGGMESRYFGLAKTHLQVLWSAALLNIERLIVIGATITGPTSSPAVMA